MFSDSEVFEAARLHSQTISFPSQFFLPSGMSKKEKELIDSHVSTSQCAKAIDALLKHATKVARRKEEHELLPGREENVWLVLSVKKVTPEKKLKAHKMYCNILLHCPHYQHFTDEVRNILCLSMILSVNETQPARAPHRRPAHDPRLPHHQRPPKRVQGPPRETQRQICEPRRRYREAQGQVQDVRGAADAHKGERALFGG
jgi:hypothetical protein